MQIPKLVNIEQVSDGWIKKYILTYDMPNGTKHVYESVSRKGIDEYRALLEADGSEKALMDADAVSVVAKTPRDTIVMVREFRYPINDWCIGFPAGLIDAGEDAISSVRRELLEETGYAVIDGAKIKSLRQASFSTTGMSDETLQVVFVEAEKVAEPTLEPNELIELFELPISEIQQFLEENKTPIGVRAQLILGSIASIMPFCEQ